MILIGSQLSEVTIDLATAKGCKIENAQITEIDITEKNQFSLFKKYENDSTHLRTDATPRYNCHGMTFASRRTGIYRAEDLKQILKEDDYIQINSTNVLPGDVIIYFSPDGDFEHSGIVVSSPNESGLGVPRVVSKWGKFAEFSHWANNCPYNFSNVRYFRIKVYGNQSSQ
ncbi:hypothetical protein [Janthinobacterium sp. EB271-G4-7A]|uniref:hypothetical protein n=1 Tax=Janthinobacterium sp. EB271-G4-7A TaxID=2775056 RepID=UPI001E398387|nr:hypothetical protein [Janthinobacterium sp. EB271-G4-7A]MCC7699074.1 hypothetical protein [Janthinobacterium sp. EB271-G4-7A]